MQHEYDIFMRGVAEWFDKHPVFASNSSPVIHSVRSRLKTEDHLKEKLRRKYTSRDPITRNNVFDKITDFAGVRVLHFHKQQFVEIQEQINEKVCGLKDWVLYEKPKAYTWDPESASFFDKRGLDVQLKDSYYTSVHYVVKPRKDSPVSCEIQVRTLFEEIWGEVDHSLNYPVASDNASCVEQLRVLAKLVGAGSRLVDSIYHAAGNGQLNRVTR